MSLAVTGWFPEGVLQFVFPAQRQLPHLTYLRFGNTLDLRDDVPIAPPPVWAAADLSRLVDCCPKLCTFVDVSLQHGTHVSILSRLQDLRTLHVQYGDFDGVGLDAFPLVIERTDYAATVKGLATLSQLYCLHCKDGGWLVEKFFTLLPLTSLTALTALQLVDYNLDEHDFRLRQVCQASRKG